MIHPNQIKRRADEDAVSAPTVERDYVLTHVLAAIASHDERGQIVLREGPRCGSAISTTIDTQPSRDRDPDRFAEYFESRVDRWRDRWESELPEYVSSPPHFDGVIRAVRRELRFALKR